MAIRELQRWIMSNGEPWIQIDGNEEILLWLYNDSGFDRESFWTVNRKINMREEVYSVVLLKWGTRK